MGEFRFKQFTVRQDASALKVGTDAVLLGAAMTLLPSDRTLLDVGTGTGVIALMAAQRLAERGLAVPDSDGGSPPITSHLAVPAFDGGSPPITSPRRLSNATPLRPVSIVAIDIDGPSAAEAAANFAASPWPGMLSARHCSLQDFAPDAPLDVIFSNPPFYDESLRNPDAREAAARHTCSLSYRDLCAFAARHLAPDGRLSLILPAECEAALLRTAVSFGLHPFRILRILTTAGKAPRRIVAGFSRGRAAFREESLTLMSGASRTPEYSLLTAPFYL